MKKRTGSMRLTDKIEQVVQLKNGRILSNLTVKRVYMVNSKMTGHLINPRSGADITVRHLSGQCWSA